MTIDEAHENAALHLTRTFDAPRELVWDAWTNPVHAQQWWAPHGYTNPVYEADLRPGGRFYVEMRAPDGTIHPNDGVYEDVVEFERVVVRGKVHLNKDSAFDVRTTVTFRDDDGKTTVTVDQEYWNVSPAAEFAIGGAAEGWKQSLERFSDVLATVIKEHHS